MTFLILIRTGRFCDNSVLNNYCVNETIAGKGVQSRWLSQQDSERLFAKIGKKQKKNAEEDTLTCYLSRYRECEEDSRWKQQVVNMCVFACVHACDRRRRGSEEAGCDSGRISPIALHVSQGAALAFLWRSCVLCRSSELTGAACQCWCALDSAIACPPALACH